VQTFLALYERALVEQALDEPAAVSPGGATWIQPPEERRRVQAGDVVGESGDAEVCR
jgi:hypothetical protein